MRIPLALVVALISLAACRTPPPRALPVDEREVSPPESGTVLLADLRASVLEAYGTLRAGYDEAYLDGLARDGRLLLIDVAPGDVLLGFDPAAGGLRRRIPADAHDIVSKALEVELARDRSVAWTFDELSYRVLRGARRAFVPLRATGVYERYSGRWVLVMGHVSYGVPDERAFADAASWPAPPPPVPVPDATAPTAAAREVRAVLLALLRDDPAARRRHVSLAEGSLLLGSAPARELRGRAIADVSTLRALYGGDVRTRAEGMRVEISRSGTVAWAVANVVVEGTRGGRALALWLRVSWVLEARSGRWRVVQTHASVPVTQDALAAEVLGRPDDRSEAGLEVSGRRAAGDEETDR